MNRLVILVGLALALPHVAAAQGMNLHWDDCMLGSPSGDKTDDCALNFGPPNKLVISLEPQQVITGVNGVVGVIDLQVDEWLLPHFWRHDVSGCRNGTLTVDAFIGSSTPPFSCDEPWSQVGSQLGGVSYEVFTTGLNRARIAWVVAVPGTIVLDPDVASEWYLAALNLSRFRTVLCTGCPIPACIVLNSVQLLRPSGDPRGNLVITNPAVSQHVTWQGGGTINCPGATPVQARSWGQVKSMYR